MTRALTSSSFPPGPSLALTAILAGLLPGSAPAAYAQAPAARMMPDGSRDLYLGIGAQRAPRYMGSGERDTDPALLLQMQWSNGVFVSGLGAGLHLIEGSRLEAGPLVSIEPGRDATGRQRASGIGGIGGLDLPSLGAASPASASTTEVLRFNRVKTSPQAGGFLNYYLNENLRLVSSLQYGSGNDHDGLLLKAGIQQSIAAAAHHRVSVAASATWANASHTRDYFGVSSATGGVPSYLPSSGVRDVQLAVNWNWEWSTRWMLASQLSVTRLMGDAADSPLSERRTGIGLRTGLAYRF